MSDENKVKRLSVGTLGEYESEGGDYVLYEDLRDARNSLMRASDTLSMYV